MRAQISQSPDTFNDAELSLMAMQIMQDLQAKESLDADEELTNLAIEIMQDLSTKPNLDPTDSYIHKLDGIDLFNHDINTSTSNLHQIHEIDDSNHSLNDISDDISLQHEGFQFEPEISTSHSNTSETSTSPSLPPSTNASIISPSLQYINTYSTDNTLNTTTTTDQNMVYISYPQMSPQILSSNRLVADDSFINDGINIPSIPSPNNKNHKRAVNGWIQYQNHKREWKNNLNMIKSYDSIGTSGSKLPYIQPPTLFIDKSASKTSDFTLSPKSISSDIQSCLSPRDKTPKQRNAKIPNFTNCISPNNTIASNRSQPKKIPNKKKIKKKYIEKHPIKKVISPIFIDVNMNGNGNNFIAKRSKSYKQLMSSTTPTVKQMNYNIKKIKKKKGRKTRAKSIACARPNYENINEYAIETNDGFTFVAPYKL